MNPDQVHAQSALRIGRLRLRVPGADAEAGRAFARQFTGELAARCQSLSATHVGAMHLRVPLPAEQQLPGAAAALAAETVVSRLNSQGEHHA